LYGKIEDMWDFISSLSVEMRATLYAAIAGIAGLIVYFVTFQVAGFLGRRFPEQFEWFDENYLAILRAPGRFLIPMVAIYGSSFAWRAELGEQTNEFLGHALFIALVVAIAWFSVRFVALAHSIVSKEFDIDREDNLEARKVLTQTEIARRLVVVFIWIVATAAVLLHFKELREIGAGLLASAGIAGVVVGIAAQRTLGTVFAGLHIALTQPIRVDDVVVIEGEWGRVEEITLTYVVVRIWDKRRLIVPVDFIMKQPFQNWTRTAADVMGTVYLRLDYLVPIEELREELERATHDNELWDEKVCVLQVTDVTDRAVELRALVSAADSPSLWDLRCQVREALVEYVAEHYPDALPVTRVRLPRESGTLRETADKQAAR
jgi:small-conductance mechanosensitive channel